MDEVAVRFKNFGEVVRAEYTNTYDRKRRSLGAWLDRVAPGRAAAEWERLAPDIVHINKQNLEDGLDLLRAARGVSVPSVCTIHITQSAAFLGAKGAWLRDAISRRVVSGYRGMLVTVSGPRNDDLRDFLGGNPAVTTIPNGVPIPARLAEGERERIRAELGVAQGELAILALGRMTAQKRPMLFIEIAGRVLARVPEAKFFWIGDGPLAGEWDARAAALGIVPRAQRLGWREDVTGLLASGDLLLHTAEYEGMPLAILEAMAAGLPCAVSDALHRELPFLNEGNSIRVSDDGELIRVLLDRGELARRAAAAREMAVRRLSSEAMAAAYEELYKKRIAERAGA